MSETPMTDKRLAEIEAKWLQVRSPQHFVHDVFDLIAALRAARSERDEARKRIAELTAEVESLRAERTLLRARVVVASSFNNPEEDEDS